MELQRPEQLYKTKSPVSTHERGRRSSTYEDMTPLSRSPARMGPLKYGTGKFSNVELVPQPSNLAEDPLNWSNLKKNSAFASLLLTVATIGTLKTLLVTVNAVVATELNVSYGASVALTGLPLIMGASFGIKSRILAQSIGKRGIQVVSALVMLLAGVWNMHVMGDYTEFMVSRIFQGIGWGMFESLMDDAIADMFFEHERAAKRSTFQMVSVFFTWGSPILGGYLSQQTMSFRNQIMILNIVQAFGVLALFLFAPETTFNRDSILPTPTLVGKEGTLATTVPATNGGFKAYLSTLKPTGPHSTRKFSKHTAGVTLKGLFTPSALLTTLLSGPLYGTAFGLAQSLSLLLSALPTFLMPTHIGHIFIAPTIMSLFTFSCTSLLSRRGASGALVSAALGTVTGVAGLLAFGMYTANTLMNIESSGVFALNTMAAISLTTTGCLFGILVSGAVALHTASSSYLTSFPTSLEVPAASKAMQELMTGIWTIALPVWVQGMAMGMDMDVPEAMWMGLKETSVALSVVSVVISSTVGAALWAKGKDLRRGDEKVLGERNEGKDFFDA